MKEVAFFDADGTLNDGFSIFHIYNGFADEGLITNGENERLQEVLANYTAGLLKYRVFVTESLRIGAEVLKGRKIRAANRIAELYFSRPDFPWFGYVQPTMEEMARHEVLSLLVTAEPQFIARGVRRSLGFTFSYNSEFDVNPNGEFVGTVLRTLGSMNKGNAVKELILPGRHTTAFGDSEGDIGMLELVDRPVCIKPTENLRSVAEARDWTIVDNPNITEPLVQFGHTHID